MDSFKARILRCVDRGLASIGDTAKRVVYWHLENTFKLKVDEIPDRPERLSHALHRMYGPAAMMLEANIIREIASEFDLRETPTDLAKAVRSARESIAKV